MFFIKPQWTLFDENDFSWQNTKSKPLWIIKTALLSSLFCGRLGINLFVFLIPKIPVIRIAVFTFRNLISLAALVLDDGEPGKYVLGIITILFSLPVFLCYMY